MMLYDKLLSELLPHAEEGYKAFIKKLLKNDKINVLGVRMPTLRRIAKKYVCDAESLINLPDDYFEITYIKLSAVALLPYDKYISLLDECVKRIDNWATCDSFKANCVNLRQADFLPYIEKYLAASGEFAQRFALTSLLYFYVKEEYLNLIFSAVERADTRKYYVHMAAAWLLAEVTVKFFSEGTEYLKRDALDKKTHNKAIQKACESLRLNEEQKTYLKGLKR
jgi:3-methyladenine DNA glycosylase AlkD